MSELETSYRLPREPYLRAVEMLSGLNEFKPEGTSKDRHRLAYPDRFAADVPDFYATRGNCPKHAQFKRLRALFVSNSAIMRAICVEIRTLAA